MTAAMSWFVSVVMVLGLVVALHQLGFDVGASLGLALQNAVRVLGQPLLPS